MLRVVNDLRYGLRALRRTPTLTLVAVLSIALGIGINAAVFSFIDAVLLNPFPYAASDSLVFLWASDSYAERRGISAPDLADWQAQNEVFEDIVPFITGEEFELRNSESNIVHGAYVGTGLFQLLGARPLSGRTFVHNEDQSGSERVAVISYGLWQSEFGGSNGAIGKAVSINGNLHTVVGVMPRDFFFPDQDIQIWVPIPNSILSTNRRGTPLFHAIARLRSGVTIPQARTELDGIVQRLNLTYPDGKEEASVGVFALSRVIIGKYRTALWTVFGAVVLLLLIACANVANLLMARGASRTKEMAIRTALGATRSIILRQVLTESLLLSFFGGLAGLLIAASGLRVIRTFYLTDVPRMGQATLNAKVFLFTLGVSIASGLIFGIAPAIKAAQAEPLESLKLGGTTSTHSGPGKLADIFVLAEVMLAFPLLLSAALLVRSFVQLTRADRGFRPDHLLMVSVKLPQPMWRSLSQQIQVTRDISVSLKSLAGVQSVAMAHGVPIRFNWNPTQLAVGGQFRTRGWVSGMWIVSPDYFRTMGIPLLRGREFGEEDASGATRVIVVSKALAEKLWPGRDPIGQHLDILQPTKKIREKLHLNPSLVDSAEYDNPASWEKQGMTCEIIGEVGNVRSFGLDIDDPAPAFYSNYTQQPNAFASEEKFLVRTQGHPDKLAVAAKDRILANNAEITVGEIATFEELVSRSIGGRGSNKLMMLVSSLFGSLGLILSIAGLYGVMSYSVAQRSYEIGVRIALGAQHTHTLKLIIRQGMMVVLAGLSLGVLVALILGRLLSNYLFGIQPTDLNTYLAVFALFSLVAFIACYFPARRATQFDPATILRAG